MCLTKKNVDYLYKSEEVEDKLGELEMFWVALT